MESTFLDLLAAVSANRTVIAGLKARAILLADLDPADRRASQYVRDGFELHAHPDLEERLDEAAPGKPGGRTVGVYGFPVLVVESVIYAVAMGTSTIALRLPIGQIRADVLEHGGAADSVFGSDGRRRCLDQGPTVDRGN